MNIYGLKEVDSIALIQSRKKLEIVFTTFIKSILHAKDITEVSLPKYKKEKRYITAIKHSFQIITL